MRKNRIYRIRTGVGDGTPVVSFNIDSSIEHYEILSLSISQKNAYRLMSSDTGVIAGRVLANGGFGIPNARVSVFVQYDDEADLRKRVLYHFSSPKSYGDDGVRYNLLPESSDDVCHQNVGTFPNKRVVLDDDSWIDVFDKYYRYTTKTNAAGDYMIYGVPTGSQQVHMDVDLSDIGPLSQRPRDMMVEGYNDNMFENPNKFRSGKNLDSLVQIKSQDSTVFVYPFWGDTTVTPTNASITRHDINVNYTFKPTCVFLGSVMSDTGENSLSKKCVASKKQGKMSEMMTGEGRIEMIRKAFNGDTEEFSVQGNKLIDGDGVWCYQIPMNLDYVVTDEFGNTVLSDNPEKGIPTRARVRFRVSMSESPNDGIARKRARYLIPNNPHLIESDYPVFSKTKEPDYEFGTKTRDESFRDLMWNNVYTVKSYIPRVQKSNLPNNLKHVGIKAVNHSGGNNPMPFNNLRIKMNFTYMFMCALTKILVYMVLGINTVVTALSYALFKIAQFIIALTNVGLIGRLLTKTLASYKGFPKENSTIPDEKFLNISKYCKVKTNKFSTFIGAKDIESEMDEDDDDDADGSMSKTYKAACYMLAVIGRIDYEYATNPLDPTKSRFSYLNWKIGKDVAFGESQVYGIKGFAARLMVIVYIIGCGIKLSGLCETDDGEEIVVSPGTLDVINDILAYAEDNYWKLGDIEQCDDNVSLLFNCIENELAQDNEVATFNFSNDWVNGVLYFPLWYRRIKPKRKFLGINIKAKDQWCSTDASWIRSNLDKRQIKVYSTCSQKRTVMTNADTGMGEYIKPLDQAYDTVNVDLSVADDETGTEVLVFNSYNDRNCYGYQCHKNARSYVPMRSGLMKEKETIVGDLVYYYKPCEYNTRYTGDLITLFATDIVLLGSLSDCDLHGIPQFFKSLEGTTYNMPPDLVSEAFEYSDESSSSANDDENGDEIDKETRITEYTGADWGNLGGDQSGEPNANENIYDNGGLFYGITCLNAFTKPKSCINLSRICEFGVSLDESQDILSTTMVGNNPSALTENMYSTLTPDGFVSYDEIYNPDYRSMFATLNSNFLRTKLNYMTGMYEYDFNHLYTDNFDGSLSNLMREASVNGNTFNTEYNRKANYTGNHNLEKSSDAYLDFRYGNYLKKHKNGQKKIYFYEYGPNITVATPVGPKPVTSTNTRDRIPRYENSFYFYFGLHEGKTAIDRFYTSYYSDCRNDEELPQNYTIDTEANSVCPVGTMDGFIAFSFNADPPFEITLTNADNDAEVYHTKEINEQMFYFGTMPEGEEYEGFAAYKHVDLYLASTETVVPFIPNGTYNVSILVNNEDTLYDTIELRTPRIEHVVEKTDFTCQNIDLESTFEELNPDGSYDWSVMFPTIAEYVDDEDSPIVLPDGKINRFIYGYIKVGGIDIDNYMISVEPVSTYFFEDHETHAMLYAAPWIKVVEGSVVDSGGNGYLGNNGTDYYFGVPYGNQTYRVKITQLCYDSGTLTETSNYTIDTITVYDGDFRMYLNGIDYDMIRAFNTGWTVTRLDSSGTYNADDLYGWDDLDNIGRYYSASANDAVPITELGYATPTDTINAVGSALCDDYDGNGASYFIGTSDCSTPYAWTSEYCISSEDWNGYASKFENGTKVVYYDGESTSVMAVSNASLVIDTEGNVTARQYYCGSELAATEDAGGSVVYEEGYSSLSGLLLTDIIDAVDMINTVIGYREEFVSRMKGAFRIGYNGTEMTVTYRSKSTPIKFLIGGSVETISRKYEDGYEDKWSDAGLNDEKSVFDPNMNTNSILFSLPTITYDPAAHDYVPYDKGGITKIPYYVAIQNSAGVAIPGKSSSIGTNAAAHSGRIIDNFGTETRTNPYIDRMFGVHFFGNPIHYSNRLTVCGIDGTVKYGDANQPTIECKSLCIGHAENGLNPVTVTLDNVPNSVKVAEITIGTTPEPTRYAENVRLVYDDSQTYGVYVNSQDYKEGGATISYQYFTPSRNQTITVKDDYGPGYSRTIYDDYSFNASAVKYAGNATDIMIPLSFGRSLPGGTVYHAYRYDGTNHPSDYAVYDGSAWSFDGDEPGQEDKMNTMFKPTTDVNTIPGQIGTTSTTMYNYVISSDTVPNKIFFIAENSGLRIRVFSPVLELDNIISVLNFNLDETRPYQDGFTIYLLRRPFESVGTRTGCDITEFYYLTRGYFTLTLKYYDTESGQQVEALSYDIDGRTLPVVDVNITDYDETPEVHTSGKALKISLASHRADFVMYGNKIPTWMTVWITDTNGMEKSCIATRGNVDVVES